MMTTGSGDGSGGPFAAIDPKLTMFALANGMDLSKGEDYRRLEWYSDGRERGIVLEPSQDGVFRVVVIAWDGDAPEDGVHELVHDGAGASVLTQVMEDAIGVANDL